MSYLTCWRLCLAADLLRTTDDTLATIAREVGYANPSAFSSAFLRFYEVRPGQYRHSAQALETMPPQARGAEPPLEPMLA